MSNTQTAFGFKHIGFRPGASPDYQLSTRLIASSNTTSIYYGDPVAKVGGTQYIAQASNTTAMIDGIFQGCMLIPATGGAPTWSPFYPGSAGADVTAYIMESGDALFMAAAFNTNISSTAIGAAISFHTGTGSTVGGGFSGFTLDQATIATTATVATTLPFQIVGLYGMGQGNFGAVGNGSDSTSAYNWAIVSFNNQRFNSLAGT